MNINQRLEAAWIKWCHDPEGNNIPFTDIYPWAVTITMKQQCFAADGLTRINLNKEEAQRNFRIFRHKLNDHLFGRNWSKKGNGIRVVPFLGGLHESLSLGCRDDHWWNSKEGGNRTGTHIHYHAAFGLELATHLHGSPLKTPRTIKEIASLVVYVHNKTAFGKGIRKIDVTPTRDTGWLGYGGHQDVPKNGVATWDSVDLTNRITS